MSHGLKWTRCGDALPDVCEPILTARWDSLEGIWRVYDGCLYVRHEDVLPNIADIKNGKPSRDWWFDSIFPGKGNMRLGYEDLLWAPLPTPE